MHFYIIRRLLQAIPVLLIVTIIVFSLLHFLPGCPASSILGEEASSADIQRLREAMGLNRPVYIQYLDWVSGLIQGDFGTSLRDGREVFPTLMRRLPATIHLLIFSMIISISIGIPVGVLSAVKQNSPLDYFSRVFALLGISIPNFWLGLMLMLLFAYYLQWLPPSGRGTIAHLIMPSIALGTSSAGLITRLTRSSLLEVIRTDYIRTARSKGLRERKVIYGHALKNALLPVTTVIGLQMGYRLGGSIVTEAVFSYPGIGNFTYQRLLSRDMPVVMGNLFLFASMFVVINLITDITYGFLDPRIRYD